jgi:hypothetical protein
MKTGASADLCDELDCICLPVPAGLMAQIAPTAMIFIPCRDGLSHHPDEYASPEQIVRGVKTLALTLAQLAGGTIPYDRAEL